MEVPLMETCSSKHLLYASVIAVFAISQSMGAVDGAIAKIAQAFQISESTAMYCSTIASLVSVAASLIVGTFAGSKVGYRPIAVISGFLLVLGGVLPVIASDFFTLCLCRALFGIGLGGILATMNPIAAALIPDPVAGARVLGIGTFVAFGFNCVEDVIGGCLADISWNYAFLCYALLAIPYLFFALTLPSVPKVPPQDSGGTIRIPTRLWLMSLMFFAIGVSIAPLLIGCSFLSTNIIDSASVAGVIAVAFSVGCCLGGLLFTRLFEHLGGRSMALYCLIAAVGLVACATTRSIVVLFVFMVVSGTGFSAFMAGMQMLARTVCNPRSVSLGSGLAMAALNIGTFACSSWMNVVGKLCGEPLYGTVYIGAALCALFAAILFFRNPFPHREHA